MILFPAGYSASTPFTSHSNVADIAAAETAGRDDGETQGWMC